MKLPLLVGLAIAGVISPLKSQASTLPVTATICNSCGPAALRQEAIDLGNGDHYIYDFVNHRLTHYSVAGQSPKLTSRGLVLSNASTYITQVPITADQQKIFDDVENFYNANGGSVFGFADSSVNILIPSQTSATSNLRNTFGAATSASRPMTAFDMVQTPAYRSLVYANQKSLSNMDGWSNNLKVAAGILVNDLNALPFIKIPVSVKVRVRFPDGSTSIIDYDFAYGDFKYVPGSSVDGVGNPIPESLSEVAGTGSRTYVFPGTLAGDNAANAQVSNMEKMGLNIPIYHYSGGWILACSNTGGQLPKCTAWPQ